MIEQLIHKYRIKDKNISNSVVFLKLKEAVTTKNLTEFIDELNKVKKQDYDSYVIVLNDNKILSGLTIKLILAFHNTIPHKTGLLTSEYLMTGFLMKKLDKYISTDINPKKVLTKIESKKLRLKKQ